MSHNPSLLSRLFRRGGSAVVAQAFSHAIGQPLLVEPRMGESLIGAYLHGAVDARPPVLTIGEIAPASSSADGSVSAARSVAVLNVSGGLVNRFEPGLCDPGPLSYESMRSAFDIALADDSVEAIVMRIESPGGMASGAFDLSDHVFNNRGAKPIIAVIDDYAYSAAFALAAAADEIWITRTGGAGSVGVRAFHVDQSAFNTKAGLKVTEIIAGAHKADLSPHAPLSDAALARLQDEIDGLHVMFVDAVARYRGMDAQAVLDTQALTFTGAGAVAVGFADRVGTFRELLAELKAHPKEKPAKKTEASSDPVQPGAQAPVAPVAQVEPAPAPAPAARDTRGEVVGLIVAADLSPPVALALLNRSSLTMDNVHGCITEAQEIDDACAAAGMRNYAANYVAKGVSIQIVRDQLQSAKVAGTQELTTTPPATVGGAAASGVWGSTIRKFGGN